MFLLGYLIGMFGLMGQYVTVAVSAAIGGIITSFSLHQISWRCNGTYSMKHLPEKWGF